MVGPVSVFLAMIRRALRDLTAAFEAIRPARGTPGEEAAVRALYASLPETNFSRDILAQNAERLAVLPVLGVRWSDWGDPGRVLGALAPMGVWPDWAGVPVAVPA